MRLSLTLLLCSVLLITSQANAALEQADISADLWKILQHTSKELSTLMHKEGNIDDISVLLANPCKHIPKSPKNIESQVWQQKSEALADNMGVKLKGGYSFQIRDSQDDDDDDGTTYLELNWDILKEGYLSNSEKSEAARYKSQLSKLQAEQDSYQYLVRCRSLNISNVMTLAETRLLNIKHDFIKPVVEIEKRAYFKGWSFLDDFLVSESEYQGLKLSLQRLNDASLISNNSLPPFTLNPPIIDIDLTAVIEEIKNDALALRALKAEKMSAFHDSRATNEKDRLEFYVRQKFQQENSSIDDDGMVAGLRFSIPLSRQNKSLLSYQYQKADAVHSLETWERVARAREAYVKLHEQLERSIEQQYRFIRATERLRRSLLEYSLEPETAELATAIIRTKSAIDAGLELTKAKTELYKRLNTLLGRAQVKFTPQLVRMIDVPDTQYRGRDGKRSIYLWSKTFNNTSNDRLWQFFKTKGISNVIVSASIRVNQDKLRSFLQQSATHNINVELMLGSRHWVFKENQKSALIRSVMTAERLGHLHLDIEPHTLPNYKNNRRRFLDAYGDFIASVREQLSTGDKLSVSVPLHWDEKDYVLLDRLTDEIYLMSYENSDAEHLINRIKPILDIIDSRYVTIALRPQDFTDEWHMEKTIKKLIDHLGINKIAIHNTRSYLKQSEK